MWRWISGVQRAIRQHIHGPRASASGVCKEEEHELEAATREETCNYKAQHRRHDHCRYSTNHEESGEKNPGKDEKGPDQGRGHKQSPCDFWEIFSKQGPFEAIGWGTIVILGLHISRKPHADLWKQEKKRHPFCLHGVLPKTAYALPDKGLTKTSVLETDQKLHIDTGQVQFSSLLEETATESNDSRESPVCSPEKPIDPLEKVMKEFENVCRRYTSMGKNMEGVRQAASGKLKQAVNSWSEASQLGYAKAQYNLGLCYETGKGVMRDIKKAVTYYKTAADADHPQAMYNLAILYLTGDGVNLDEKAAIALMKRAAKLGLVQAQTYLGVYYTGEPTLDMEKAVYYFKQAVEQNDIEAEYFLGICYERGWGVEQNMCKAASLYAQAASDGHDGAMYNLAVFHEHGLGGLPEDSITALELYTKSAAAGNESAQCYLDQQNPQTTHRQAEWKEQYMYDFVEEPLIEKPKQEVVESEKEPEIQTPTIRNPILHLSISVSTPSLTDYVRKHIQDLNLGSSLRDFAQLGFTKSSVFNEEPCLQNHRTSFSLWQPQYGSPRFASSSTAGSGSGVSFFVGANEDDLDANNVLWNDLEAVNEWRTEGSETGQHHFSSVVQRHSTMPDISALSCS